MVIPENEMSSLDAPKYGELRDVGEPGDLSQAYGPGKERLPGATVRERDGARSPAFGGPRGAVAESGFRTLVENSPDIISRVDRDGRYLYANRSVEAILGVSPAAMMGRSIAEAGLPVEASDAIIVTVAAALESGAERTASFVIRMRDEVFHFMARAIPEADGEGGVQSVLSIVTDVSERARAQNEVTQLLEREHEARRQAEAAARARDQFLAIVSHELRSPLNGIQNWSYVLENHLTDPPPLARRALLGIRSGIEQQVRLIDDLLDATRIMSGKLSLVLQPTTLLPIIHAAIESVGPAANAKRIRIDTKLDLDNDTVVGDADRLQQMFWNLLSNAVKFTPADGHIRVSSSIERDSVIVQIADTGIGIAPDFLPHMFEWFRRNQTDKKRTQEGLGLGLALVRHLCDLHGGKVTASSDGVDQGATFSVRLPLNLKSPLPQPETGWLSSQSSELALAGVRVLLIDDQRESLESLATILQHAGADTTMMLSGERGREWLAHCDAREAPHVLLCDISMPGEDGYTTLRKIRANEAALGIPTACRIPAIAISASALREDRIRALASGFQMYLTKPSSIEELIAALATLTGRQLQHAALDEASR